MENTAEKIEQEIEMESQDLEIEVVDDTPEEDRGKPKRAENVPPQIPDDDEVSKYSSDVQKRIKQLKYEYHEERRQKEEAKRLSDEAITATQKLMEENKKLRKTLDDGEGVLVEQAKGRVEAQLNEAKKEYKEAYELGDPDKLLEAQEKLSSIQNEKYRVDNYKPPVRAVEPDVAPPTQQAPARPTVQAPTGKDKEWLEANNDWFQKEDYEDMTGYAMGVHQKLVKAGLNPKLDTEEYYRRIDEAMGKAFPEHFNKNKQNVETEEVEAPQRSVGSVVAPVNRSAKKPRKVQLTSTQIGLAKRLGVTPEQYAAQLLKESI